MKFDYISFNRSSRRLLIIFPGWSTTPALYADLLAEGWNILLFHGYADIRPLHPEGNSAIEEDFRDVVSQHSSVFVIAWSLGVAAAEAILSPYAERIAAAFAINGTLRPVSDSEGIPADIYHGTARALSPRNLLKFQRRMSSVGDSFQFQPDAQEISSLTESDIDYLKDELLAIETLPFSANLPWKRAYIGKTDRIFPPASQIKAWRAHCPEAQIIELNAGHFIPLQKIIREVTPDTSRIADRFRRALPTYDTNASAQARIVGNLLDMIPAEFRKSEGGKPLHILEIGPGSGLLTRALPDYVRIASIDFLDLYEVEHFGICPNERYYKADAEIWLDSMQWLSENADRDYPQYDLIISANTIQWFADIRRFFLNAKLALHPDGALLCSTYLPGNLRELDTLRPSPLLYHSRVELENHLKDFFPSPELHDEEITLRFESPRDLLHHLSATGVGGGSHCEARNLLTSLPQNPTLTYCPLYILAKFPK